MHEEHHAAVNARLRLPFQLEIEVGKLSVCHEIRKICARILVGFLQLDRAIDHRPVAAGLLFKIRMPSLQVLPVEEKLPSVLFFLRRQSIRHLRKSGPVRRSASVLRLKFAPRPSPRIEGSRQFPSILFRIHHHLLRNPELHNTSVMVTHDNRESRRQLEHNPPWFRPGGERRTCSRQGSCAAADSRSRTEFAAAFRIPCTRNTLHSVCIVGKRGVMCAASRWLMMAGNRSLEHAFLAR